MVHIAGMMEAAAIAKEFSRSSASSHYDEDIGDTIKGKRLTTGDAVAAAIIAAADRLDADLTP